MNNIITAQQLFFKLANLHLECKYGSICFNLAGVSVTINTTDTVGITPRYAQRRFDTTQSKQLILSPDARDGSLKVFQDMTLWRWNLKKGETAEYQPEQGRNIWLQVVKGKITINDTIATTSDGVAISNEDMIRFVGDEDSEVLLFDLPPVTA